MHKFISILVSLLFLISCDKENPTKVSFTERFMQLSTHRLATYSVGGSSKYLIVFEAGLGDDHTVWSTKKVAESISAKMDVIVYDRAGYGKSTIDNNLRGIDRLRTELESVVNKYANGRKVILVGHSLGGMIIRDFAIKNQNITAGLLFVDPSHEQYNQPTQAIEDLIYNSFYRSNGANFGGTREARELIEDSQYMAALTNLPDIPVIVLTSMKTDNDHSASDRQNWYDAHERLKNSINDFTHIGTKNSGHYIINDEPNLVIDKINLLISKLP